MRNLLKMSTARSALMRRMHWPGAMLTGFTRMPENLSSIVAFRAYRIQLF